MTKNSIQGKTTKQSSCFPSPPPLPPPRESSKLFCENKNSNPNVFIKIFRRRSSSLSLLFRLRAELIRQDCFCHHRLHPTTHHNTRGTTCLHKNHHNGRGPSNTSNMGFFTHPTSYRLANAVAGNDVGSSLPSRSFTDFAFGAIARRASDGESHPALGHLILLVFEAVMEVVCVSLPGYIVARQGMFDADKQKFVANLNVALFTPCLSM
jgi:hypothetical protein